MSTAPQSSKDVRHYIAEKAGVPGANISIRSARSNRGYHAGKDQIFGPGGKGNKDYSVKDPRDKAGLTNASAAIDVKIPRKALKALTANFVERAQAGQLANKVAEIIGPSADGKATYWSESGGWKPVLGWWVWKKGKRVWEPVDPSHEWHMHLGLRRNTEFDDRVALFRPFFEPVATPAPVIEPEDPDADDALNTADIEGLEAENTKLRGILEAIGASVAEALTEV